MFQLLRYYPQILIAVLAVVSTLFVFSSLFAVLVSVLPIDRAMRDERRREEGKLAQLLTSLGFFGLLALFPLLLLPFSAAILTVIEGVILRIWFTIIRAPRPPPPSR
jgi:hypothetical protein